MTTTPLLEFLKARIAEDEAAARSAAEAKWSGMNWEHPPESGDVNIVGGRSLMDYPDMDDAPAEHIARNDPARILAECAAKRSIVQYAEALWFEKGRDSETLARYASMLWTVQRLASAYADHPDYGPDLAA